MLPRLLFIAWMASLGADRVDLFGGRGPAVLLLFHVLTPLVAVAFFWPSRRGASGQDDTSATTPSLLKVPAAIRGYAALLLALLTLVGLSLLRSEDLSVSAGRFTLFTATVLGVAVVLWGLWARSDREALLQTGARAGLAVSIAFNLASLLVLLGALPASLEIGPSLINLQPLTYGLLPRLAGPTVDMNRGAMLVLVFGSLIAMGPRRSAWWLSAAALMLVGSLSRSAMLAAATVLAVAMWQRRRATARVQGNPIVATAFLVAVCVLGALQLNPALRERSAATLAPLAERFNPQEGSAQTHAYLFERGVEVGTRSLPGAMLGSGWGTSFHELADVFDGNRYGNYHSAWLQVWVETGFVVMLLAMAVALLPLRRRPRLAGLVLGLFVYNVFYIGITEPQFWLATGLAWLEPGA